MKKRITHQFALLIVLTIVASCAKVETASEIIKKTISTIDTIETISYKQDMFRSNPRNADDTIFRYREMTFRRLITDSIVGVVGHWYMYLPEQKNVIYEDIYNGNRLIRKNNRDSIVRLYDLVKYPEFKQSHFWGHNTLFGMQYEFRYILDNIGPYTIERLTDTIIDDIYCHQIEVYLRDYVTMPGFATEIIKSEGNNNKTTYYINVKNNYPIRMVGISYLSETTEIQTFIDQRYYDIEFNLLIDDGNSFNTTDESIIGFKRTEMIPE